MALLTEHCCICIVLEIQWMRIFLSRFQVDMWSYFFILLSKYKFQISKSRLNAWTGSRCCMIYRVRSNVSLSYDMRVDLNKEDRDYNIFIPDIPNWIQLIGLYVRWPWLIQRPLHDLLDLKLEQFHAHTSWCENDSHGLNLWQISRPMRLGIHTEITLVLNVLIYSHI